MKKKLKVQKAFSGKMIKAATAQGKKVIKPGFLGLPPRPPGTVPGSGAGIVKPGQINPFGPGGLPIGGYGSQQPGRPPRDPNMFSTTPPRPDIQFGVQPLPAAPNFGGPMQPSSQIDPIPFASAVKPGMQQPAPGGIAEYVLRQKNAPGGLGGGQINPGMQQPGRQPGIYQQGGPPRDPNMYSTLPFRPDIQFGVQPLPAAPGPLGGSVTQPAPMQQQAAPVQPVPAMKKGGIVRGGRAEIKGTRPAKLS